VIVAGRETEVRTVEELAGMGHGVSAALAKAELDQQISTAKAYPRSMSRFLDEVMSIVSMNEAIAEECSYALPRDGKVIEGPSARLAEIVVSMWGNCRAGARVLDEDDEFVTVQGFFHDLERNVGISYEVRRRIVDRHGRKYSADMRTVTANAACSIALRNAVFKGVPKAFWNAAYLRSVEIANGGIDTLEKKRGAALEFLKRKFGVTEERVFAALGVKGHEEMTLDHLQTLRGVTNALKESEVTAEEAFPMPGAAAKEAEGSKGAEGLKERMAARAAKSLAQTAAEVVVGVATEAIEKVLAEETVALVHAEGCAGTPEGGTLTAGCAACAAWGKANGVAMTEELDFGEATQAEEPTATSSKRGRK